MLASCPPLDDVIVIWRAQSQGNDDEKRDLVFVYDTHAPDFRRLRDR